MKLEYEQFRKYRLDGRMSVVVNSNADVATPNCWCITFYDVRGVRMLHYCGHEPSKIREAALRDVKRWRRGERADE